ncbi:MAG: rane protein [Chloroflexota bacterium]|jgi:membrane protein|nr:rane protein [Chloroflexota bacterium]
MATISAPARRGSNATGMSVERARQSLVGKLALKFTEDKAINWAVQIAWSALLALFPMILVMVSILGLVMSTAGVASDHLYQNILAIMPTPQAQADAVTALKGFQRQSGPLAIVGFAGLLVGGSALFGAMEQAFAIIYHTRPRGFLKQKLMSFGMILVFTVLAGVAVGTSAILPILSKLPFAPAGIRSGAVVWVIQVATGVVAGLLLFLAIYFVVPNRRQRFAQVWPGALLAGTLFEALTLLFPVYLGINKGLSAYGPQFGLMFLLMTFFFFLGIITMIGVEFNAVLYPLPVEQPDRAAAMAPPQSGPEGERLVVGSPTSNYPRRIDTATAGDAKPGDSTPDESEHGGSVADDGVEVLTPEMAEEANAGIAGLAAARERVGKARTLIGVGALAWAVGVLVGRRAGKR